MSLVLIKTNNTTYWFKIVQIWGMEMGRIYFPLHDHSGHFTSFCMWLMQKPIEVTKCQVQYRGRGVCQPVSDFGKLEHNGKMNLYSFLPWKVSNLKTISYSYSYVFFPNHYIVLAILWFLTLLIFTFLNWDRLLNK